MGKLLWGLPPAASAVPGHPLPQTHRMPAAAWLQQEDVGQVGVKGGQRQAAPQTWPLPLTSALGSTSPKAVPRRHRHRRTLNLELARHMSPFPLSNGATHTSPFLLSNGPTQKPSPWGYGKQLLSHTLGSARSSSGGALRHCRIVPVWLSVSQACSG